MSHSSPNLQFIVQPGGSLHGNVRVPGDKSISHRSIMLGSLAEGTTHVSGFLQGEDCLCTLKAFRSMGVQIEGPDEDGKVTIHGVGLHGLKAPTSALDMGNSGTSMRLMSGLMSGQAFDVRMTGDASLSKRPMKRVTVPLGSMGAAIDATDTGTPPLLVHGGRQLHGIHYPMPVASAQVKSSLLLAGLYAEGETSVTEPAPTRDHTERMLRGFGYEVHTEGNHIRLQGGGKLTATDIDVPSDISSAAFFMVGASIAPGSDLLLQHVGINPTRTGIIDILRLMGANLEILNQREVGGEPVADIRVRYAPLKGIQIPEALVPLAIDEFPALFIAAAFAEGQTVLTGAEELRVKESDRIQVMADGLVACGVDAQPTPDGIIINPGNFSGGTIDSHGDHRIAMSFAMAALCASQPITINDCTNVNTSFPNFVGLATRAGVKITAQEDLLAYIPSPLALQGRVILVTGAASGLGRVISKACAQYGATVVILDKEMRRAEETYDEIVAAGYPEPAIYPLDMQGANAQDYAALADNIRTQLGRLDGIVLNAAWLAAFTPVAHYETELWAKMIMVNLQANFLLTHACLPLLGEAQDPAIVFADHESNKAYFGAFGVAKAGMRGFCDILAAEYSDPANFVRVNSVDTGAIRTSMRTLNFPGENPESVARPEAVVAPFLFYLGADAGKRSGEHLKLPRQPADATWAGEVTGT